MTEFVRLGTEEAYSDHTGAGAYAIGFGFDLEKGTCSAPLISISRFCFGALSELFVIELDLFNALIVGVCASIWKSRVLFWNPRMV